MRLIYLLNYFRPDIENIDRNYILSPGLTLAMNAWLKHSCAAF